MPNNLKSTVYRISCCELCKKRFHCFLLLIAAEGAKSHKETEKSEQEEEKDEEEKTDGPRSRSSSTSSEDYIIILPDCFDTTRPLGESMYRYLFPMKSESVLSLKATANWSVLNNTSLSHSSSALSQPGDISGKTEAETDSPDDSGATGEEVGEPAVLPETGVSGSSSANDMLCTSQTLDDEPLLPEVVAPPTTRSVGM